MDYLFLHGGSNVTVRTHREGYEAGYSLDVSHSVYNTICDSRSVFSLSGLNSIEFY